MVLSRTSTAPTCLRSQVARVATTRAMFMKYSSQLTRVSMRPPCRALHLARGLMIPDPAAEHRGLLGSPHDDHDGASRLRPRGRSHAAGDRTAPSPRRDL